MPYSVVIYAESTCSTATKTSCGDFMTTSAVKRILHHRHQNASSSRGINGFKYIALQLSAGRFCYRLVPKANYGVPKRAQGGGGEIYYGTIPPPPELS